MISHYNFGKRKYHTKYKIVQNLNLYYKVFSYVTNASVAVKGTKYLF